MSINHNLLKALPQCSVMTCAGMCLVCLEEEMYHGTKKKKQKSPKTSQAHRKKKRQTKTKLSDWCGLSRRLVQWRTVRDGENEHSGTPDKKHLS